MALFDSVVKTTLFACLIHFGQDVIFIALPLTQVLDNTAYITCLTKLEERTNLAHALSGNRGLGVPFEIEVTFLEALDNFKLVANHPVFLGILLEVKREVAANHGTGELFC